MATRQRGVNGVRRTISYGTYTLTRKNDHQICLTITTDLNGTDFPNRAGQDVEVSLRQYEDGREPELIVKPEE